MLEAIVKGNLVVVLEHIRAWEALLEHLSRKLEHIRAWEPAAER